MVSIKALLTCKGNPVLWCNSLLGRTCKTASSPGQPCVRGGKQSWDNGQPKTCNNIRFSFTPMEKSVYKTRVQISCCKIKEFREETKETSKRLKFRTSGRPQPFPGRGCMDTFPSPFCCTSRTCWRTCSTACFWSGTWGWCWCSWPCSWWLRRGSWSCGFWSKHRARPRRTLRPPSRTFSGSTDAGRRGEPGKVGPWREEGVEQKGLQAAVGLVPLKIISGH